MNGALQIIFFFRAEDGGEEPGGGFAGSLLVMFVGA